ncbi:MAG: adenylosuccinate synthase [Flavobacteriales bacterium]|nr:adenylosuccinate synthase [Flavobacteriales bacterium]MBP6575233.1 adenylosuccinate synthase [Flavobacteriales bacterium]
MAKVDVLLGAQWGDEGKGKVVDTITPRYKVVARFQGGPNAGHTLIIDGKKHVLHTIPSGVFRPGIVNLVGNGVVIDPVIFMREVDALKAIGIDVKENLRIGRRAHLILPSHRTLDAASEADKGKGKIGSTLKGIGPTYMDKTGRNGLRVGDLERSDLAERYDTLKRKHERLLTLYESTGVQTTNEQEWMDAVKRLRELPLVDSEHFIDETLRAGHDVLAEGAQGTLLDIDFGTYPFVTSSNTISAGACTGLGVAPSRIGRVIGIFKAYCTRVGSGPFPTELDNDLGENIRQAGGEFGSTTGRPRRCGWLDIPALRYAVMINGITELAMTKADVLSGMAEVSLCTHYKVNGRMTDRMPYDISTDIEPIFESMVGWKDRSSIDGRLSAFIERVEQAVGVPITMVSMGPGREQMVLRETAAVH